MSFRHFATLISSLALVSAPVRAQEHPVRRLANIVSVAVEEYGRGGHFERELPGARELYASHWRALDGALREHMPEGVAWIYARS